MLQEGRLACRCRERRHLAGGRYRPRARTRRRRWQREPREPLVQHGKVDHPRALPLVLGRMWAGRSQAPRIAHPGHRGVHRVDHDAMLPTRAQVIGVGDDLAGTARDHGQRDVIVPAVIQGRTPVAVPADHELVQVVPVPAEQQLDDLVQSGEREIRGDLHLPPRRHRHLQQ